MLRRFFGNIAIERDFLPLIRHWKKLHLKASQGGDRLNSLKIGWQKLDKSIFNNIHITVTIFNDF